MAPVHHCVVMTLDSNKVGLDSAALSRQVDQLLARCRQTIPGLIEVHFGAANDSSKGPTHVIWSRHCNPDALQVYLYHPDRLAINALLRGCAIKPAIAIDFQQSNSRFTAKL